MSAQHAWSLPLGRAGQVPVRLHLSFLLLAALVAFEASATSSSFLPEVSFILGLFIAVALHETAHIAVALRLGVSTRESVLYPFGGVSSLARDVGPRVELAIACAGPIANALLATLLAPLADNITEPSQFAESSFVTKLFASNVVLVIFNLVPAFPLDGGRILRSILSLIPTKHPTETVVRVSQGASIVLGVVALVSMNVFLIVIAAVIFGSAVREMVRTQALAVGKQVLARSAMIDAAQLVVFSHGTSLPDAANKAVRSFQPVFPITHPGALIGYVMRDELLQAATRGEENNYVGSFAQKNFLSFSPDATAAEVSERMSQNSEEVAFVVDDGQLKGMIIREKLIEFLLLQGVRRHIEDSETDDRDEPFF